MHRTTSGATLVAALVLCLAANHVAHAQEGWGATPDLLSDVVATDGLIHSPKVGVDAAGNAVALWTDRGPTILGPGPVVRTARYDVTTRMWSPPFTLSGGERTALAADVAVDSAGNAVAVWRTNPISVPFLVKAARYEAATRAWSPVTTVVGAAGNAHVAVGPGGHFAVCWAADFPTTGVSCSRYAPGSGWAAAEPISATGLVSGVALDAAGNVTVLLETRSLVVLDGVSARRFDAGTATWGAVTPLASGLPATPQSRLAMNAAGAGVVTWTRDQSIDAARYVPGAGWTSTEVAAGGSGPFFNENARPVVDAAGAITVAFIERKFELRGPVFHSVRVSRFTGSAWSGPIVLPDHLGFAYGPPAIDVDGGGNVHVVASQSLISPGIRLLASRYAVATGQWTTASHLSAIDQAAYSPDVAIDSHGNAVAVWFQSASGFSVPQALTWTATSAPPAVSSGSPGTGAITLGLQTPTGSDPALAATNIEYSIDDGETWTARTPADPVAPLTISGLVDGTRYLVRLRTVNAAGSGRASAALPLRSGLSTEAGDLRVVSRVGNTITLAWTAAPAGLEPDAYQLEGSVSDPWRVLAVVPTGGTATQVTLAVPDGTFLVRVRGLRGTVPVALSAMVLISVNTGPTPTPPRTLLGSANGSALALSWRNTWEYAVPTGIRLTVSGTLAGTLDLPLSESFAFPSMPPGTYTFAVSALNGIADSGPSLPPVTLTFPGSCSGAPQSPAAFSASTQGGTVYLDWLPPSSGEAVASYVVSVTGAFTGSFPMATRTLAAPVPPGSYTVRVQSIGLCGASTFTAPQTVVVP